MARPTILNPLERKFILLLGDMAIILLALNVLVNHAIDKEFISLNVKVSLFSVGTLLFLLLAYILDFYNLERELRKRQMLSQSLYITIIFVILTFLFTILAYDASFWRIPLLVFLILTPFQIFLWRLLFVNLFKILPTSKNVLYIYDSYTEDRFKEDVQKINGEDIETYHQVKLTFNKDQQTIENKRIFREAIDKIDTWIINVKSYTAIPPTLESLILNAVVNGREVVSFTSFYENTYEALPINSHNDSFYEILQLRQRKIRYLQKIFSFGVNFLLSLGVGIFFLLVIPMVWILNLFGNRGPLFYTQKRVGQFGKEFKIYKFRSMVVDAEKGGAKMAARNDARITPVGKFLRAFRIDELPQIISVIRGDMQFIGPRPERKVFVNELNSIIPFYNTRHLIKPGITGWAQVKFKYGENLEDSVQKLEYDLYYIKNRSITLDLRIIFKTITTVIFSRGM